jgi:DNA-binding CsgD family transcriptional regulator
MTGRQLQTLRMYAQGYTMKEIAEKLSLSVRTVEEHMKGAKVSLNAKNSVNAVAVAIQKGIISLLILISTWQAVFDMYSCDMRRPQPVRVRVVRTVKANQQKDA